MASAGDERIMKEFSISTEKMGMIYSAFLIVYTVLMVPGGLFIDRFGPRLALALMGLSTALFCAFTGAIGWGFIAAAQVWLSLMVVRSLMGLFTTPLHPACARVLRRIGSRTVNARWPTASSLALPSLLTPLSIRCSAP